MAEGGGWSPLTLLSVFGLAAVSALIYAGTTMQRISQLETNDDKFTIQLSQMAESRYAKQAEFESKLAALEKTDAARSEELKNVHVEIGRVQTTVDQSAKDLQSKAAILLDRLGDLDASIAGLRYGLMRSDERGQPR